MDIRCYPGAGGNIAKNLVAMGIGQVATISVLGVDGQGFDLKRALQQSGVDTTWTLESPDVHTPTFTKPMMHEPHKTPYEMERIDIENRQPLPRQIEDAVIDTLKSNIDQFHGVIVIDQVQASCYGVVTDRVREQVVRLSARYPEKVFFADSRNNIGKFRSAIVKPNRQELAQALGVDDLSRADHNELIRAGRKLCKRTGRGLLITLGQQGLLVIDGDAATTIPSFRLTGQIDIVGAGDSVTTGTVAALCAGASLSEAALIGNLAASITIEQLGVTGTANQDQLRSRLIEYNEQQAGSAGH